MPRASSTRPRSGLFNDEVPGDNFRDRFSEEPNFGLFPFFLSLYELVVGFVEGSFGGIVIADEESEVFGDAGFA